jgi:hypothetical protein
MRSSNSVLVNRYRADVSGFAGVGGLPALAPLVAPLGIFRPAKLLFEVAMGEKLVLLLPALPGLLESGLSSLLPAHPILNEYQSVGKIENSQ